MDEHRHEGKRILVTGGGSGIGRATAYRFAAEGAAAVSILDRDPSRVESVVAELASRGTKAHGIVADLQDPEASRDAVSEAAEQMGGLDVTLSNAAAHTDEKFIEMALESWQMVIDVNLTASFVIGQRSAQLMRDSGGSILFTASVSSLGASTGYAHYGATKAGIANLVTTMAIELVDYGIRVNCVSPGPADTQQSVDICGEELMEKWRTEGFPVVPMKRLASPDDIAAAYSYLASDDASYVTGINLVVDGGLTAHAYSVPED